MQTNSLNPIVPSRAFIPTTSVAAVPEESGAAFPNLESSVTLSGAPPAEKKEKKAPVKELAAPPPAPPSKAVAQSNGPLLMEDGPALGLASGASAPTRNLNAPLVMENVAAPQSAGTNFELQALLHSFLENPEVQQAAQNGTAGKNLGQLMDALSQHLGENLGIKQSNVFVSGDTEGRVTNDFNTLKEQGVIYKDADGQMKFRDQGAGFLFMGDLMDWGPAGLKLAEEMVSLKASAPDRVAFIWGNRDLGKLAIHNDLPDLENMAGETGMLYARWLADKAGGGHSSDPEAVAHLNTDANRVQYYLEAHSAPQALEFHRQALEEKHGKPVTADEAARDYVASWKPGGIFFEFLKQGSFAAPPELMGETHMAFHGGAARENITSIPGEAELPKDLNGIIQGQFDMGRRLIAEAEADINAGRRVKSMLLSLGDSNWMASAGINAARAESVIYSERNVEDGNLRGHEKEVAEAMQKVGKHTELVGHTPIGSIPEMRLSPEGTVKIYTDNSMAKDGSQAMVAHKGDLTISVSRVGDKENGRVVFFAHQPGAETNFGKITSDGFAVVGMTLDGQYFLSKYEPGFKLTQLAVSAEELAARNPQAHRPEDSHARRATHQQVSAAIENKMSQWNTPILNFEALDQVRDGRTPVLISAASSYGRHPATQEQLQAMSESLKTTFNGNVMVIDGGTSVKSSSGEKAPELIVQETLFPPDRIEDPFGPRRVAAMPSVANLDEVTHRPDAMVVVGGAEDWHLPAIEATKYVGGCNGAAVFIGGGGAVAKAIEAARGETGTHVFLVRGRGEEPMGASDKVARQEDLPSHFHVIYADELGQLGSRIHAAVGEGL